MPDRCALPTKFPCWVKAVYSWSGETKRDLGFVEGDLIECLNAGDGQWWFGRLKRNHTTGTFPSNFVQIVEAPGGSASATRPRLPLSAPNLNDEYVPPSPTTPHAPVPPPHRVSYIGPSTPVRDDGYSPEPSPSNRTPTPVRSAMQEVIHSLDNMSVADGIDSPDIDDYYSAASHNTEPSFSRRKSRSQRPKSSIGFHHKPYAGFDHLPPDYPEEQKPPALLTYSARLEERIRRLERNRDPEHPLYPHELTPPSHAPFPQQLPYKSMGITHPNLDRTHTMNSTSTATGSSVSGATIFSHESKASTAISSVSAFSATSAASMARRKVEEAGTNTGSLSLSALDLSSVNARDSPRTLKSKRSGFLKRLLKTKKSSDAITQAKNGPLDWTKSRRDMHRANSLSRLELQQRLDKAVVDGFKVLAPVDVLEQEVQGDEHADGGVVDDPMDVSKVNFSQVDKAVRFMTTVPAHTGPSSFAAGYLCRPYKSDLQCARAIFSFMTEKMTWEPTSAVPLDECDLSIHLANVLQSRRAGAEEMALCIKGMCDGIGIECELVRGYLKTPGEAIDLETLPKPNHFWNAMIVDSEWRIMDASLASPSNPRRALYTRSSGPDNFYFLMKPLQAAYTHVPMRCEQQHLVRPADPEVLLALPYACPPFFSNRLRMHGFNTSLTRMDGLEVAQIDLAVPQDIECVAEIELGAVALDVDGDVFDTGDVIRIQALAQVTWEKGQRLYRIKAVLPPGETHGSLKIYAGKKGFMHSIRDNPHPLCLALPLFQAGNNEPFAFVTRHPIPHAQRHDLYVSQPQCRTLVVNNTYVFSIRQHPATPSSLASKPAKLAIQAPGGKIVRIKCNGESGHYELVTKVQESGIWRGLVLADRSARWCVFAEWHVA